MYELQDAAYDAITSFILFWLEDKREAKRFVSVSIKPINILFYFKSLPQIGQQEMSLSSICCPQTGQVVVPT